MAFMTLLPVLALLTAAATGGSNAKNTEDKKFKPIARNADCGFDKIDVTLNVESYLYDVTGGLFAIYSTSELCHPDKPLYVSLPSKPGHQFTMEHDTCTYFFDAILAPDGSPAAYFARERLYGRKYNPFTDVPFGDYYQFDITCLVYAQYSTTNTAAKPNTTTTATHAPPMTTTASQCTCCTCNCECHCPWAEFAQALANATTAVQGHRGGEM